MPAEITASVVRGLDIYLLPWKQFWVWYKAAVFLCTAGWYGGGEEYVNSVLKKWIGLQSRDEQSNNNAKEVQKEDAGWYGSHKGEARLMAKYSVNLKSRHFTDISYSIFNKFTYPHACPHFCFFLLMFSFFQIILCLPSLHRRAKYAFGRMEKAWTPMTHMCCSAHQDIW